MDKEFGTRRVSLLLTTTGKVCDNLGMTIDSSETRKVHLTMYNYLQDIIASLPDHLKSNRMVNTPGADHLFEINEQAAQKLDKQRNSTSTLLNSCL